MADQPKKPRKIKDLKARLGRTIAPATQKASGGVAPPPGMGGGGIAPPPGGVGGAVPPPGGVAPPPFLQRQQEEEAKAKAAGGEDPFGSQPPPAAAGPREVRLVIDEKPVDDAEVGRKARGRTLMVIAIGAVLGLGVGYGLASTLKDRSLYAAAAEDGRAVYQKVQGAANPLQEAQALLQKVKRAARAGQGNEPSVDFASIQALATLEEPFTASDFARKNYKAFNPGTVDKLFDFYNKVVLLWSRFSDLQTMTASEARRTAIESAAKAGAETATTDIGCLPLQQEEGESNQGFKCALVFLTQGGETGIQAHSSLSRPGHDVSLARSGSLGEDPSKTAILLDKDKSRSILGERAGEYSEFMREVATIEELLQKTTQARGELEQQLGSVATLAD